MKVIIVMHDWRQINQPDSIYNTDLGVLLSEGDLHSGTSFEAEVNIPADVEQELRDAWRDHRAYPVFRIYQPYSRDAQ